jgi:hypothetical protein
MNKSVELIEKNRNRSILSDLVSKDESVNSGLVYV